MSYYGKAAANPDFLESWQTQLDAIRDIFSHTRKARASLTESGTGKTDPGDGQEDGLATLPSGNPISLRRKRNSKVGGATAVDAVAAGGSDETDDHLDGDDLEGDEPLSDLQKDKNKFVRWLRARHAQEVAGVALGNYGEQVEAAELEQLKLQQRRRSSIELGELEERSASAEEHVRRFSFNGDCVSTIEAHEDAVNCIATLDNGNIITGSEDMALKVWNPNQAKLICTLNGHSEGVNCVTQLTDADTVASGSDREILVWSIAECAVLKSLKGHSSYVWGLLMVDGLLTSASADKTVRLWCVERKRPEFGECFSVLEEHRDSVYSIAKFPDGTTMATGSADTTVVIWKGAGHTHHYVRSRVLRGHTKLVYSLVAVGPAYLASASDDWTIRLWDCDSGSCLSCLDGHDAAVTSLAAFLGPGGSQVPILFSGSRDCDAKLWDLTTMKCERTLAGHRDEVLCISVLASTHHCGVLATGCEDGTVKIWGIVQM
eukprot:m.221718 g.221718  ORF g.221718 m.221718 type:complete len:489 (+) comp25807_c2_seq2:263-1729(+)